MAALREAEARGLDIESSLPRLAAARSLTGVDDPIAVLHARAKRWAAAATSNRQVGAGLIAGLIPGRSAWTTRTWPVPSKNETRPWSAGPGSWPNRR